MAPDDPRKHQDPPAGGEAPPGRHQVSAPDRAAMEIRRYFRRWVPWAGIYALGFLVLWATGLAGTQAFYVWAIGWVLVWGAWVHMDYVRRYLQPGSRRSRRGDDDPS